MSMTTAQLRARRASIAEERAAITAQCLKPEGQDDASWTAAMERRAHLDTEYAKLERLEAMKAADDEAERRAAGQPVGTGDRHLDAALSRVGLGDVIRASMGATDHAAGLAREASTEMERRSGRKAQGMFWHMSAPVESRVLTTALPGGGPGSNIIPTDYRGDLFIDRLRNKTRVRALGATMLTGLSGNVAIPRRKASVTSGWVAENAALTAADPQFDQVTMSPKHAGALTEYSRNLLLQSSPDIEQLLRNDMALQLAETLDAAAIYGTGSSNQPRGILNTSGIGAVPMGTNGGALTFDAVADLMGAVDDANGEGTAFLTNTKVRRAASKIKDSTGLPLGVQTIFQGMTPTISNIVPANLTKGTANAICSALIYGAWSDLLIGMWSELDILVNPYESTAYAKGNVQVRAMMTVDIAVRQPASFAAIQDILA